MRAQIPLGAVQDLPVHQCNVPICIHERTLQRVVHHMPSQPGIATSRPKCKICRVPQAHTASHPEVALWGMDSQQTGQASLSRQILAFVEGSHFNAMIGRALTILQVSLQTSEQAIVQGMCDLVKSIEINTNIMYEMSHTWR